MPIIGLLILLFMASVPMSSGPVEAVSCGGANRFWVGGTGSWSDTTHWSALSGGIIGATVPDTTNAVFFDTLSGVGTVTLDVTALSCNVDATSTTITAISMGSQTWRIVGDITNLQGKTTVGTSTLELSGSATQTIGPQSGTNLALATIRISGVGTKVFNQRIVPTGWTQNVSAEVDMGTGAIGVVGFFPVFTLLDAGPGNLLTIKSTSPGTKWNFQPQVATMSLRRVSITDADVTGATLVFATDISNTDGGNNGALIQFLPKSSVVEENSSWFSTSSLDYGPVAVRNSVGGIVVMMPDGTSFNNGKLSVRYSTDGGGTWSARIPLMTPSADGTGILDSSVGTGWEIFAVVTRTNTMYVTGHKLLSGTTHTYFTKVDISDVRNVATFSNWKNAAGVPAASQGSAVNGHGYDDLGAKADPGIVVTITGSIYVGLSGVGPATTSQVAKWTGSAWTFATLDFGGNNPEDLVLVYDNLNGDIFLFAHITLSARLQIVSKRCPNIASCTDGTKWTALDGVGLYDIVISNAAGDFGFPHAVIDSVNTVHIIAASKFTVAGFSRMFHNYLVNGDSTWRNGQSLNAAGLEINAASAYPARTRVKSSSQDRFWVGADTAAEVYLSYQDQQADRSGPAIWNGTTWGNQTYTIAGNSLSGSLRTRAGVNYVDILTVPITGQVNGIQFQSVPSTNGGTPWWDAQPLIVTQDTTILWLFIFAFILLLVFGFILHSLFFIFAGIEGVFMAYQMWVFTGNEIVAGIFFAVALMVLVIGTFRFIEEEVL